MRIVIISNNYPPRIIGGAVVVASAYAEKFQSLGNEVVVFAADGTGYIPTLEIHKEFYNNVWVWRVGINEAIASMEMYA